MHKNDATILLIDDDEDDWDIFQLALSEAAPSYKFFTAKNGMEALEKLKAREKPDCIFLDMNMPRMNGSQCIEEIRKKPELHKIPIIIYSTSTDARHQEQMLALGATEFITKPSNIEELIVSLKNIFVKI